ncbi:putative MFS transporter [Mycena sanguinolenta]|uniref:Putative MFS transporter n=1 Tax=Mycena sanguinolenta TaxID=230812 RepID=A0A8H6XQJ5_9AGAR|nr:putative MFS transporter [Mycena sanguinolenta]
MVRPPVVVVVQALTLVAPWLFAHADRLLGRSGHCILLSSARGTAFTPLSVTTMSTAKETMIFTPELLEHTLVHLPMRDLLVAAPLVSKAWHAITRSPLLQRALFFEPDPASTELVQNPLLVELFAPFFSPPGDDPDAWSWPGSVAAFEAMPWATRSAAFCRADASWRRMLVTQPPTQTLVVTQKHHTMSGNYVRRAVLRDLSLRMGVLYDLSMPFIDEGATFRIHWEGQIKNYGSNNGEGDATIEVWKSVSCMPQTGRFLDERFDSKGRIKVKVNFGENVYVGWD